MRKCMGMMSVLVLCATTAVLAGERPDRATKGQELSFRVAHSKPVTGFDAVTLTDGSVVYISQRDSFGAHDVLGAELLPDGSGMEVVLTDTARNELAQADRVAVYMNRQLVGVPALSGVSAEGVTTFSGLSDTDANRVSRIVKEVSASYNGPVISVVPQQATGAAGGVFVVDVYANNIRGLRTYQVSVDAVGGMQGALRQEGMIVDISHPQYVFGDSQVVKAEDPQRGRMGAVLFTGVVDVEQPMYLGTYTFRATNDASGTFSLRVRMNGDSILAGMDSERMSFRPANAVITVGAPSRLGR